MWDCEVLNSGVSNVNKWIIQMNVTLKEVDYEEKIFQMNDVILYFVYCFSKYMNNS